MFKEFMNELLLGGWRVYYNTTFQSSHLQKLARNRFVEIRVYDDKPFVFVKTVFPKDNKKPKNE